jgi:hypothetical protein
MPNMAVKYKDLQQVAAAFASGELDRSKYVLILDNDCSYLTYCGPLPDGMIEGSAEADAWSAQHHAEVDGWFSGRGYADLLDACLAAGIPAEWC